MRSIFPGNSIFVLSLLTSTSIFQFTFNIWNQEKKRLFLVLHNERWCCHLQVQLSNVYRRQICGILELESYLTSPPWFRLNASKLLASKLFVLFYKVAHKLEAVCDTRVFAANGYMDLCARRTLGWTRYIYVHSRLNLLGNILSFLMLRCPSITLICK